jgi:hypothetical protein
VWRQRISRAQHSSVECKHVRGNISLFECCMVHDACQQMHMGTGFVQAMHKLQASRRTVCKLTPKQQRLNGSACR